MLYQERTGNGPAILFVHGSFGAADAWVGQPARLSDRRACVRCDRWGQARSAAGDATASVTHAMTAVRAFADEIDRRAAPAAPIAPDWRRQP